MKAILLLVFFFGDFASFGVPSSSIFRPRKTVEERTAKPFTLGLPSTPNPFPLSFTTVSTPCPGLCGIDGICSDDKTSETFDCANGKKINKTLVCNRINDCEDGSDESKCEPWPPKITNLPKHKVEVYCGEKDEDSGTLVLECESVGYPTPVIRWKKYDGHVPSKCQQYSKRGRGVLTCPGFRQSDQGSYSCVAENSVKSAESQPKSIAKCNNTINCRGFKVINEEQIEHCVECYCSGKATQCQSIKSYKTPINIPFAHSESEIFAKENGEVVFIPTKTSPFPDSSVRSFAQEITYCTLSEDDLPEKSLLKSFGRSVIYPRHEATTDFMENAPNIIIRGNGLSLMYTARLVSPLRSNIYAAARFWPGNWHHLNKTLANRRDIMKVLSNVDSLFFRCEYTEGKAVSLGENMYITIESSAISASSNSVSFIEKCTCPAGYEGLSCETCAVGYKRKPAGNDFFCEKIDVPPCKEGYIGTNCSACDTAKNYHKVGEACVKAVCNSEGSVSLFLNIHKKCTCRPRVTGDFCDKCEKGSFYLNRNSGCLTCWCSGVSNECTSSSLYRTVISSMPRGGYNSSDGRNFWLLPKEFKGNRLTSYGGHLNYTMKYKPGTPKQKTNLTVELLSTDDITLVYTHPLVDTPVTNNGIIWFVPLTEINWKTPDKRPVTRGEFLTVLSRIKAIYIESPYPLFSGLANLTHTRMSSASSSGNGDNILALEVEHCVCPKGYTGLSCEKCVDGYYRKRNGTIHECIKCNCTNCDPNFGCQGCPQLTYRDNPEEEKIPMCKPCPCKENGVSCEKDDLGQIFCRCKPGFTGMHCENIIPKDKGDLTISISPRIIKDRMEGTSVSINCSVTSSEEMKLSAKLSYTKGTHNDTHIILGRGRKFSENFPVVLKNGLQSIECLVHDADEKKAGCIVTAVRNIITVIKPVKITNCYTNRIDVKESESKDIICEAVGSPTPMINWYTTSNGSAIEKLDTSDGVHSIEVASLRDNGTTYTCIAENSEGDKDTCTMVLIVRKKCDVVIIIPKEVRITEGQNATVQCKTTAKSEVAWFVYDTFLEKEKSISSPRIRIQKGELRIINASVTDSGVYMCTAEGENGKLNQTLSVKVEQKRIPPTASIMEYDKTLNVGDYFAIHCLVTGQPTPTTTWTKLNGSLDSNVVPFRDTLKINKATIKNSGVYVCEARSSSGSASSFISINVVHPSITPRVNVSDEIITAFLGDEVNLTCLAMGYPQPKLTWFPITSNFSIISRKVNDIVLPEPQKTIQETIKFTVTKNIDKVSCLASNSAGRDEKKVTVVKQSVISANETAVRVPIGSYYELYCSFAGDSSLEIKWERADGRLIGDECPILNSLMIPSVQIQHNGTYICSNAENSSQIFHLFVVGFVPKFSKSSSSYLVLPIKFELSTEFRMEITFRATHENGILLQDEYRNLNVYLKKSSVHVSVYSEKNDLLDIVMNKPIVLEKWYTLVLSITMQYVDLTIYGETSIGERKTEDVKNFNVSMKSFSENLFLGGGIPKGRHNHRLFLGRHFHFDGCISRLSINRKELDIVFSGSYSYNVSLCRRCAQQENPCGEKGKCLDSPTQYGFICVCPTEKSKSCPAGCTGKGCETKLNLCNLLNPCGNYLTHKCQQHVSSLQCHCAYGYSGVTCENNQEYSFCVKGNGYVKLPTALLERKVGKPETIRMAVTLYKPTGHLLWQGDGLNYLSIAVDEGKLRYVYWNQNSMLQINTRKQVSLENKFTLHVRRINDTAVLEIINGWGSLSEEYRNTTSAYHTNRVTGPIYLGNTPNNTYSTYGGLDGCIHYISFGENAKVNLPEAGIEKFNTFQAQKVSSDYSSGDDSLDYDSGGYSNEIDY